jgi:hypothetical protein
MEAMLSLPLPGHMPCERCGASVAAEDAGTHTCDEERCLDFAVFQLRGEVAAFGDALHGWLETTRGRFEVFYAERTRTDR